MADLLQITHEPHGILRLTLNDPARRNALSEAMLDHLWDAIQLANDDASVRAVIIAANGTANLRSRRSSVRRRAAASQPPRAFEFSA